MLDVQDFNGRLSAGPAWSIDLTETEPAAARRPAGQTIAEHATRPAQLASPAEVAKRRHPEACRGPPRPDPRRRLQRAQQIRRHATLYIYRISGHPATAQAQGKTMTINVVMIGAE